jgi:hypothetical protein
MSTRSPFSVTRAGSKRYYEAISEPRTKNPEPGTQNQEPRTEPRTPNPEPRTQDERQAVQATRISGRASRPRAAKATSRTARAAGRPQDTEPDGISRGVPVLAMREPPCAAGGRRRPLRAVRGRSPQLHPVCGVRYQCALRVHPGDRRAGRAEGRAERLHVLCAEDNRRASDRHTGPDERQTSVR